jgi:hypothetical protein
VPPSVTLLEPPAAGPKGSLYLRRGLTDGAPGTGDMSAGQGLTVIDDHLAVGDLVALIIREEDPDTYRVALNAQ